MRKIAGFVCVSLLAIQVYGQLAPKPMASQEELLKSSDPKIAANKKLVYDFWPEVLRRATWILRTNTCGRTTCSTIRMPRPG